MKKIIALLCFVLFLYIFLGSASAANPFNSIGVVYHGSWQWGSVNYHTYELKDDIRKAEKYILDFFYFDLDDEDERKIQINYLGTVFDVEFQRGALGGSWVKVTILKDKKESWELSKELNTLYDTVLDFDEVGIRIEANWETLAFETDVKIERIALKERLMNKILNARFTEENKNRLIDLANAMQTINNKFRVLEITNRDITFGFNEGEAFLIHAKTEIFDEEDSTGKTKSLVITENKIIKYVIMMPEKWGTVFNVYKPSEEIDITTIDTFEELAKLLDSKKMTKIPAQEVDYSEFEKYLGYWAEASAGVGAGGAVATGLGAGLLSSGAATIMAATAAPILSGVTGVTLAEGTVVTITYSATGAQIVTIAGMAPPIIGGGTGAAVGGAAVGGGAVIGTGGTILIVAAAVALVAGGTYIAIEGTKTHTMVADPSKIGDATLYNLTFNWDREYLTLASEGKINFILIPKDILTPSWIGLQITDLPEGTDLAKTFETLDLFSDTMMIVKVKFDKQVGQDGKTIYIKPEGLKENLNIIYYIKLQPKDSSNNNLGPDGTIKIEIQNLDIAEDLEVPK